MMERALEKMLDNFEEYCTNDIVSGKARSYKLAITYLFDFLNISQFEEIDLQNLKQTKNSLRNIDSLDYADCLLFLKNRRQSSYLKKGFINAALGQFFTFMRKND